VGVEKCRSFAEFTLSEGEALRMIGSRRGVGNRKYPAGGELGIFFLTRMEGKGYKFNCNSFAIMIAFGLQ
jgi:hypothetical protein